jgi:UDP-glucuronate decarboxylase
MATRVLVTGGAGFLGSHLSERLLAEGADVICVDNFSSGQRVNVAQFTDNDAFELLNRDVRLPGSLPQVDQIYHLASRASPADFTEYPVEIALANTQGTRNLLDHAVGCGARMIFASTSEVYGDPEQHPQAETYNGNVNIRGDRGCYDESKRFGEALTVAYRREHNLEVRTARIFNTYGPRMRANDGRAVPTFISQALASKDLTVYGSGEQTRSFCYVTDLVDGLYQLMNTDKIHDSVFNIGNTNEIEINELAQLVTDIVDTPSEIT